MIQLESSKDGPDDIDRHSISNAMANSTLSNTLSLEPVWNHAHKAEKLFLLDEPQLGGDKVGPLLGPCGSDRRDVLELDHRSLSIHIAHKEIEQWIFLFLFDGGLEAVDQIGQSNRILREFWLTFVIKQEDQGHARHSRRRQHFGQLPFLQT